MTQTWLLTGASRGMGVEFARAALAAGHNIAATGRNPETVRAAVGEHKNLLVTALDVTDPHSAEDAAAAAVARFGRIDVLLNNAGSFLAGFFEELTTEQVRSQIETNLFGPMTVTRSVLPAMRRQHCGLVISISSSGRGVRGSVGVGVRGVEVRVGRLDGSAERRGAAVRDPHDDRGAGLLPHRAADARVGPFGELSIDDYDEARAQTKDFWTSMNGTLAEVDAHRECRPASPTNTSP